MKRKNTADGRILRLARIWTVILGVISTTIAVIWTDIIDLLLFTYHVWAPAIILPVVVGTMTKRKDKTMVRNIFITMLVTTFITLAYRLTTYTESFDPAVFGVGVSVVVYFGLEFIGKIKRVWNAA